MPDREEVIQAIADWIDIQAIAEALYDAAEDADLEPTVENLQEVWLRVLGVTDLGGSAEVVAEQYSKEE